MLEFSGQLTMADRFSYHTGFAPSESATESAHVRTTCRFDQSRSKYNLVFRSNPIPEAEMSNRLINDASGSDNIISVYIGQTIPEAEMLKRLIDEFTLRT